MLKKTSLLLITATLLVSLLGTALFTSTPAAAVNGSDWKAGRIIDDSVFTDKNSMSVNDIQTFLNQKVGTGGSVYATPGFCDSQGTRTSEFGGGTRAQYGTSVGHPAPFTCLKDYYEVPKTEPGPEIPASNYGGVAIPSGAVSAAQLIWDAAQRSNISPKVLLVMIQKESAGPLTTDDWPFQSQYKYALGAYCPDSRDGPKCNANYAGFSIQIAESAALLRYYLDSMQQPWWSNKKPYQTNNILWQTIYDGDGNLTNCGGSDVYIETMATAALYTYTPYQPNAAALTNANMYGTGDYCSAYGNRNFWRIFNDWFGKSVYITNIKWEPAIISQSSGKINAFARGYDSRLWQTWFDNTGWQSKWNYIDVPNTISSAPSGISFGEGHMDVFETRNGSLWHSWYKNDATTWRPWSTLGAPLGVWLGRTPATVTQVPGKINVFARGSDGRLWQNWFDNTGWQSKWNYIDGPSTSSSSPTAISFGEGHMDVFETRNGSLWHSWYSSNGGWRSWQPVGRP